MYRVSKHWRFAELFVISCFYFIIHCILLTERAAFFVCLFALGNQWNTWYMYTQLQGRSERGCGGWRTPIIILSRHLEPQSANEASKVQEQGLAQNKFAAGKPRALGLPTANVFLTTVFQIVFLSTKDWRRAEYTVRNVENTTALFRANTSYMVVPASLLVIVTSYYPSPYLL